VKRSRLLSILTAVIVAVVAGGGAGVARADFTFIHASDVHFGAKRIGSTVMNADVDARMFDEISRLDPKPAFMVITGDIAEIGDDAQYALYRKTAERLGGMKLYVAPGNHDVRWNPRGKEGFVRGAGQPLYQSWDYQNIHFVTLDSTVLLEHWGHISQDQLDWLTADLKKVGTDKPVIIGFHHWVGRNPVMVDNETALFEIVRPYNIVLWLQGHGHANIDWSIDGVPAMMTGALYDATYSILHVSDDRIDITRRLIPEGKKHRGGELMYDATTQPNTAQLEHLMTIPLHRRPAPNWSAQAKFLGEKPADYQLRATAQRGELPEGTRFDVRLNSEPDYPMLPPAEDFSSTIPARHPPLMLTWGQHTVTVQATLPDKRAYQIPIHLAVPGKISPAWTHPIGGAVQSRLVRSGDSVFISSMGNDFIALDAASGAEKFRVSTGGSIFSGAAVADGTAYFGSADHFVYAVDASDGKIRWKTETGGAVLAGPAVARGIVCVGSVDTKMYGLDAASGSIVWTVAGRNMFQSQAATDGTRFFVGGWDNDFRCIDAASGKQLWTIPLGRKSAESFSPYAPAIASPAVGDGKVFISTNDGILHALDIKDRREIWRIDWLKMGYSSPLFHDGRVYCALSDEGKTFMADAASGQIKWIADTGSVIYDSSFAFGGGRVFIGCVNGVLNCINAGDGRIDWQYRVGPGHFLGSPAADDQHVYAATMAGNVIALPIHTKHK
jgi:outer membrane protein assembly factor BamB